MKRIFLFGILFSLVGGCGDAYDSSTGHGATTAALGLWVGTTDDLRAVEGVVLGDGTYFFFYSTVADTSVMGGVVVGSSTSDTTNFNSNGAKDFNIEGGGGSISDASTTATFVANTSFTGLVTSASSLATVVVTTTYDSDFGVSPNLAAVQAISPTDYTGVMALSDAPAALTMNISSTGAITGLGGTCNISGSISPRSDGNVYDVTIVTGTGCSPIGVTLHGQAYFRVLTTRLRLYAMDSTEDNAILIDATK